MFQTRAHLSFLLFLDSFPSFAGGGLVGHIEDIAVSSSAQGRKLGLRIIQALVGISEGLGCYKTILDCNRDNIGSALLSRLSHTTGFLDLEADSWVGVRCCFQLSTRSVGSLRRSTRWSVRSLVHVSPPAQAHLRLCSFLRIRPSTHQPQESTTQHHRRSSLFQLGRRGTRSSCPPTSSCFAFSFALALLCFQ